MARNGSEEDRPVENTAEKPCTATLIRGVTYSYKGHMFKKNEPWPVSRELAEDLRDNHDIDSTDSRSQERVSRPRFRVEGLDDDEDDHTARPIRRAKRPSRSTR